jgi:ribosomal-protein-alanine N-acetyltransferase
VEVFVTEAEMRMNAKGPSRTSRRWRIVFDPPQEQRMARTPAARIEAAGPSMTVDPPVRLAQPADAEDIAAMSRDLIEHGLPWNWRPARVLRAIRDPESNVAAVRMDGRLVAFGIMEYLEEDAYLALLAVSGASQRRGIGTSLLRWLEGSARVAGAQRIRLEARRDNVPARTFYNELGYHEVGIRRGRYSDGVDGVLLEKWLRTSPES